MLFQNIKTSFWSVVYTDYISTVKHVKNKSMTFGSETLKKQFLGLIWMLDPKISRLLYIDSFGRLLSKAT